MPTAGTASPGRFQRLWPASGARAYGKKRHRRNGALAHVVRVFYG